MYEIFEQLLQKYGVTAYKVSKETGITQSTLSDWKRGRSTPKTENMKKIADYFGVTVDYLMTGKKEPKEKTPELTSRDERDIAKDLNNIMENLHLAKLDQPVITVNLWIQRPLLFLKMS